MITVGTSLARAVHDHGERDAIVIGSIRLTHAQVLAEARRYARALAGHGVRAGDHIGILMPNCLEYLLLFYGCALLGARPVHFNARYKRDELRYVIADSDVKLLFTSALQRQFTDFAALLMELYPPLRTWRHGEQLRLESAPLLRGVFQFHDDTGGPWPGERTFFEHALALNPPENDDAEQIALIMYTSGTTANPKACLLSHRALETTGHAMLRRWNIVADDRLWDPLPFFHMSTMLPLAACRAAGAAFIAQTHFEPARRCAKSSTSARRSCSRRSRR